MRPSRPPRLMAVVACAAALSGSGCDNTIHPTEVLPPLNPASLDPNAGSWRMILFPVAADALMIVFHTFYFRPGNISELACAPIFILLLGLVCLQVKM